ncbi:MAG: c-type cytochrome [Gemmatimonadota bacterium]|nr:c-type cytochrome [Gemmatimonadota bacterium]
MRIAQTTWPLSLATPILLLLCPPASAQEPASEAIEVEDPERSERLYRAHCGRCHGVQGLGGEGPELAQLVLPRVADRTQLERIIRNGIPGTGMPGARATILDDEAVALVAGYVLWLGAQTTADASGVTGDADRGHDLFWAEGDCASCHIVAAQGTAVGPELTIIGLRRGADYLREALSAPAARLPVARSGARSGFFEYLPVRIVTHDGDIYNGMRMNEDSFTIQLMTVSGVFVSLRKSEIAEMERRVGHSLMPVAQDLDEDDVEDLVAYLTTLGRGS